ncbi:MAG: hypothetical protein ACAI38_23680 [Myxococcota bacterium]
MNRGLAIAAVFVAMPFALTVMRSAFAPEAAAAVQKGPRELSAVAEAEALPRRYGLAVVAMPEPPNGDGRLPVADGGSPMADDRLPITDSRAADPVTLVCPDIRAIVSGDSPFAIIAWDDASQMVTPAQTISAPAGDVLVRRISKQSITFAKADTTLQCKLSVR